MMMKITGIVAVAVAVAGCATKPATYATTKFDGTYYGKADPAPDSQEFCTARGVAAVTRRLMITNGNVRMEFSAQDNAWFDGSVDDGGNIYAQVSEHKISGAYGSLTTLRGKIIDDTANFTIENGSCAYRLSMMRKSNDSAVEPCTSSFFSSQGRLCRKAAFSGQIQKIDYAYSVNPECQSGGYPAVRIATAPHHGLLTIEQSEDYPAFPQNNIRYKCNDRKVPVTRISYRSDPDFVGVDNAIIEVIFPSGNYGKAEYTINVR